ncbi:hypothetical protein [Foetidibacter luteolus]|uniref:hypothetical protein n=1 Tax=Foetidibacter luteolus TaxID=2608880 RepID=UPI00129A2705|nr:hypothetical protein [Foetidibacter luteolus]
MIVIVFKKEFPHLHISTPGIKNSQTTAFAKSFWRQKAAETKHHPPPPNDKNLQKISLPVAALPLILLILPALPGHHLYDAANAARKTRWLSTQESFVF